MEIEDVIADITFEVYSDEALKGEYLNPFQLYEDDFQGNLLDIGCGQSPIILSMLETDLNLYGIDKDPKQIDYLLKRVSRLSPERIVETFKQSFLSEIFPEIRFNYIALENVLHLKQQIPDPASFINDVEKVMAPNARILVKVHARGDHPDQFRYYDLDGLKAIFPEKDYHTIYYSYHFGEANKFTRRFMERFCAMELDERGIFDLASRKMLTEESIDSNSMNILIVLLQKIG